MRKSIYTILILAILLGGVFMFSRSAEALDADCKGKYDLTIEAPDKVKADDTVTIIAKFSWNTTVPTDCLNTRISFGPEYKDKSGTWRSVGQVSGGVAKPQGTVVVARVSVKASSLTGLGALNDGAFVTFGFTVSDAPDTYFTRIQKDVTIDSNAPTPSGGGSSGGGGSPTGTGGGTSSGKFVIDNPIGASDFGQLVNLIAKWIFNLSIPVAIIMIIYAGLKMILAQGNPGKFTEARKILQYAIGGLAVIFIGKGFISLVMSILDLGK